MCVNLIFLIVFTLILKLVYKNEYNKHTFCFAVPDKFSTFALRIFSFTYFIWVFTASCDNSRCFFVCAQKKSPPITGRDNKNKSNLIIINHEKLT